MRSLIFDTETNGLLKRDAPAPYILELGMILVEGNRVLAAHNALLNHPDLTEVPEHITRINGISLSMLRELGQGPRDVLKHFTDLALRADRIICHNGRYDLGILPGNFERSGPDLPRDYLNIPHFCTMLSSMNVCKLPGRYGQYKWPSLDEAYRILVDPNGFSGAHAAMNDCLATHQILMRLEAIGQPLEQLNGIS